MSTEQRTQQGRPDDPLMRGRDGCYFPRCPEQAVRTRCTASGAWVGYCKLHDEQAEGMFGPAAIQKEVH